METDDHTTRTLLLSRKVHGMLLVSRGSTSNIDIDAASLASGHSQIRAFNLTNRSTTAYDFDTTGLRLGWGLRNSVGVAEHPTTGGIYSVENSADQIVRDGVDVHQNNPGEEMNFHGYLNGTDYALQGGNYGYPWCFAAWNVDELPDHGNLSVGSQFALSESNYPDNENRTDAYCAAQNAPRLTFPAHMAPLDIKFNNSGTQGWVTWHGSWDRTDPVGYKVSVIEFANGEPVAPATSKTALTDIFTNVDLSVCPNNCFRPVGMAFDGQGRLFVSSDATGEIYMITSEKAPSATSSSSGAASSATATGTSTGSQASSTSNGRRLIPDLVKSLQGAAVIVCLAAAFVIA
jgi:glucose/arabinose dehydrogenase